jgi:hypothetical protein
MTLPPFEHTLYSVSSKFAYANKARMWVSLNDVVKNGCDPVHGVGLPLNNF